MYVIQYWATLAAVCTALLCDLTIFCLFDVLVYSLGQVRTQHDTEVLLQLESEDSRNEWHEAITSNMFNHVRVQ